MYQVKSFLFLNLLFFTAFFISQQHLNKSLLKHSRFLSLQNQNYSQVKSMEDNQFSLEILAPKNKATVGSLLIQIKGKTLPNSFIFVNDKELRADAKGDFATTISLDEGENAIFLVTHDENGNYVEKELDVISETFIP